MGRNLTPNPSALRTDSLSAEEISSPWRKCHVTMMDEPFAIVVEGVDIVIEVARRIQNENPKLFFFSSQDQNRHSLKESLLTK